MHSRILIEQIQCTSNGVKFIPSKNSEEFHLPFGLSFDELEVSVPGFPSKTVINKNWDCGNRFDTESEHGDPIVTYIPMVNFTFVANSPEIPMDLIDLIDRAFRIRQENGQIVVDHCMNLKDLQYGIIGIEGSSNLYILNTYGEAIRISSSHLSPSDLGPISNNPAFTIVTDIKSLEAYSGTLDEVEKKISMASDYYKEKGIDSLRKCYITSLGNAYCFL